MDVNESYKSIFQNLDEFRFVLIEGVEIEDGTNISYILSVGWSSSKVLITVNTEELVQCENFELDDPEQSKIKMSSLLQSYHLTIKTIIYFYRSNRYKIKADCFADDGVLAFDFASRNDPEEDITYVTYNTFSKKINNRVFVQNFEYFMYLLDEKKLNIKMKGTSPKALIRRMKLEDLDIS